MLRSLHHSAIFFNDIHLFIKCVNTLPLDVWNWTLLWKLIRKCGCVGWWSFVTWSLSEGCMTQQVWQITWSSNWKKIFQCCLHTSLKSTAFLWLFTLYAHFDLPCPYWVYAPSRSHLSIFHLMLSTFPSITYPLSNIAAFIAWIAVKT